MEHHDETRTEEWRWGELFSLRIPTTLAVVDQGRAVELVPALTDTGEPDEREASRAWLTVLSPEPAALDLASTFASPEAPDPWEAAPLAITRFAASVGVSLAHDGVHRVLDRGVTWARADFDASGDTWQAIGIAWNAHVALFLISRHAGSGGDHEMESSFLAWMDAVIASWRPLEPVVAPSPRPVFSDEDGF
jgi:hypothetical protein